MRSKIFFGIICGTILFLAARAWALSLESIEIQTGFFKGNLKRQGSYEAVPLLAAFNYDAKPLFEKIGVISKGNLNFVIEPFLNTVTQPDTNVEAGINFLFRYVFPLSRNIKPFIKAGLGAGYMTQHVDEQSTQYNFFPQAGVGCLFFIKEKVAFSLEYRRRHLSNASFEYPNGGIDVNMYLGGISWFF